MEKPRGYDGSTRFESIREFPSPKCHYIQFLAGIVIFPFCFAMALSADMLDSFILQYILALWLQQGLLPELFRRGGWDWRDGGCIFA